MIETDTFFSNICFSLSLSKNKRGEEIGAIFGDERGWKILVDILKHMSSSIERNPSLNC